MKCCCHTSKQRFDWAKKRGWVPPTYAILDYGDEASPSSGTLSVDAASEANAFSINRVPSGGMKQAFESGAKSARQRLVERIEHDTASVDHCSRGSESAKQALSEESLAAQRTHKAMVRGESKSPPLIPCWDVSGCNEGVTSFVSVSWMTLELSAKTAGYHDRLSHRLSIPDALRLWDLDPPDTPPPRCLMSRNMA